MAIWEIAVAARDFGPGRAQAGDIIIARVPTGVIGKKEDKDFLWMTIENDLDRSELTEHGVGEKRKFKVNLNQLAGSEHLDKHRINDPNDAYQPLLGKPKIKKHNPQIDNQV